MTPERTVPETRPLGYPRDVWEVELVRGYVLRLSKRPSLWVRFGLWVWFGLRGRSIG